MEHVSIILGIVSTILSVGISVGIMQTKIKVLETRLDKNDKVTYENQRKIAVRNEEMIGVHKDIEELSTKLISFDNILIEMNIKLTEILTRLNIENSQKHKDRRL